MPVLSEAEVQSALKELPGWRYHRGAIEHKYEFADFRQAMEFVNRVAEVAEQVNHHPDVDIRYNKVTMSLTSHDSGGVTQRDIRMARKIAELARR